MIQEEAGDSIKAALERDDADTELALKAIFPRYPQAQVTIFSAFGGRIDHVTSNLFLLSDPELAPFMRQITLRNEQNIAQSYPVGSNQVLSEKEMIYVSFVADGNADLTIKGTKYELDASDFFKKKVYSNNKSLDQPIAVTLKPGYLIVIQSKDR